MHGHHYPRDSRYTFRLLGAFDNSSSLQTKTQTHKVKKITHTSNGVPESGQEGGVTTCLTHLFSLPPNSMACGFSHIRPARTCGFRGAAKRVLAGWAGHRCSLEQRRSRRMSEDSSLYVSLRERASRPSPSSCFLRGRPVLRRLTPSSTVPHPQSKHLQQSFLLHFDPEIDNKKKSLVIFLVKKYLHT